jgi:hypothetical protein
MHQLQKMTHKDETEVILGSESDLIEENSEKTDEEMT